MFGIKKGKRNEEGDKDGNISKVVLSVSGMMCEHCAAHVKAALTALPGVTGVLVSLDGGSAEVTVKGTPDTEALIAAVGKAGYNAAVKVNVPEK